MKKWGKKKIGRAPKDTMVVNSEEGDWIIFGIF